VQNLSDIPKPFEIEAENESFGNRLKMIVQGPNRMCDIQSAVWSPKQKNACIFPFNARVGEKSTFLFKSLIFEKKRWKHDNFFKVFQLSFLKNYNQSENV